VTETNTLHEYNEVQIGDTIGDKNRLIFMATKTSERVVGDCYASWIVATVKLGEYHPYAVWTVIASPTGFIAESGDYFFEIEDAVKRYRERGGK